MARTRISTKTETGSVRYWDPNGVVQSQYDVHGVTRTERCEDIVGSPHSDNPLLIVKTNDKRRRYSREAYAYDGNGNSYVYYSLTGIPPSALTVFASLPPTDPPPAWETVAARTSPSRPDVDLPVFLWELKDFPGMAEQVGNFAKALPKLVQLIQRAGRSLGGRGNGKVIYDLNDALLSYQLGWAPLVSDLSKLLGFAKAFERRQREMANLASGKSLRRRISLNGGSDQSTYYGFDPVQGTSDWVQFYATRTSVTRRWASARWVATLAALKPTPPSDLEVLGQMFGLNLSGAALWNAIPFSFLFDYFVNVGDYLEAQRNRAYYECVSACLMTETTESHACEVIYRSSNSLAGGDGIYEAVRKERTPITQQPLPSFSPFLSEKQVSILGGLSVAKRNAWS